MNFEKLISFSFSHLKFLDSMGFLTASLDTLVKNLHEGGAGKHKFIHSARHCAKPEHIDMLLTKGVYPYDYMRKLDHAGLEARRKELYDTFWKPNGDLDNPAPHWFSAEIRDEHDEVVRQLGHRWVTL